MLKYIVVCYDKTTDYVDCFAFDSKNEALKCIFENRSIDEKYNEKNKWFYKLIEVEVLKDEKRRFKKI